jgi:hypothetical protein
VVNEVAANHLETRLTGVPGNRIDIGRRRRTHDLLQIRVLANGRDEQLQGVC